MTGIYYGNHTTLEDRFAIHIEPQTERKEGVFVAAHTEIGDTFNQIARCLKQGESIPKKLFKELGVHPSDADALESMRDICSFIIDTDHVIIPTLDPGVFYIVNASEEAKRINVDNQQQVSDFSSKVHKGEIIPKALFKVGRKRAQLELAARRIASMIKLKDHIIFGMFASMRVEKLPKFWTDAQSGCMTEDLWNGDMKNFHPSTKGGHIVGILEPYLVEKNPTTLSLNDKLNQFARLTLLGVVLGLRDAHKRNIVAGSFVDAEEIFPERLDPDPDVTTATAAHHLTYLFEEELCQQPLNAIIIRELHDLICGVDVITLASQLQKQKKKFADFYHDDTEEVLEEDVEDYESEEEEELNSSNSSALFEPIENMDAADLGRPEEDVYQDEGRCQVRVSPYEKELNPLFTPNTTPYIFTEKACSTFIDRFLKLRTVLEEERRRPHGLSCLDIVKKVDPFFDYQARLHRLASQSFNKPPVTKAASDTSLMQRRGVKPRSTSASSIDCLRAMADPASVGRTPSPFPPSPGGKLSFESLFAQVLQLEQAVAAEESGDS